MAGTDEQEDFVKTRAMECDSSFVWDEESKLYFHASSGFYHDPNDGWYYSSRDGLYYTFENGTYVPVTCNEEEKSAARKCTSPFSSKPTQLDSGIPQHFPTDETKNELPPSQWIEETLIDLYLSGYKNEEVNSDSLLAPLTNEQGCQVQCEGQTDYLALAGPFVCQNGTENKQNDESTSDYVQNMDELTDISLSKGRVYRLRSPSMKYLVSLSTYDSSNPTKDWDFPDFLASNYEYTPVSHDQVYNLDGVDYQSSFTTIDELPSTAKKKTSSEYRDRAAERRALHGGFGTGLGQKSFLDENCISEEPQTPETDGVLNEAINASFGPGSYARKILEGMGWKHGESLGSSNKGILEPLCPAGNKGYAGLGWNHTRGEN
ncbi:hypothetical protein MA16_Dca018341 [Dendrobium catenatum]|uniref:G-patch domain-containing protein n=1 Tax=Dendrobium catenatum TaxID=906689 RepID=A0A2I0VWP6_9ASPA|nr:hypothetical protein MA16_Dca018341 [Dendrobium catenatum]